MTPTTQPLERNWPPLYKVTSQPSLYVTSVPFHLPPFTCVPTSHHHKHTSLHVLQSIMTECVSDSHLTPLPLEVQEDADLAVSAARKAFDSWSRLPGHVRARHMYCKTCPETC